MHDQANSMLAMLVCDNPPTMNPLVKLLLHLGLVRFSTKAKQDSLDLSFQRLSEDNPRFPSLSFRYLMPEFL